jgi:hypothetical protein
MKILISILVTVAIVGYYFFKEMKSDYEKDLKELKEDLENDNSV